MNGQLQEKLKGETVSSQDIAKILGDGMLVAQTEVEQYAKKHYPPSEPQPDTTLNLVIKLGTYVFSCSTGDSKAFLIKGDGASKSLNPEGETRDLSDCGGRISSYGLDARNLQITITKCDVDDGIAIFSDGVYENFDPELIGSEVPEEYTSWKEVPDSIRNNSIEKDLAETIFSKPAKDIKQAFEQNIAKRAQLEKVQVLTAVPAKNRKPGGKPDNAKAVCFPPRVK